MPSKEKPLETLGAVLGRARKESGDTLAKVEEETGYTESYVSQIQRGKAKPGLGTVLSLARYLRADVERVQALWILARVLKTFDKHPEVQELMRVALPVERIVKVMRRADAAAAASGRKPSTDPDTIAALLEHLPDEE